MPSLKRRIMASCGREGERRNGYNVTAIFAEKVSNLSEEVKSILDQFIDYHAAVGASLTGEMEIVLTFPAESLAQATRTASALLESLNPVGIEVMTTKAWVRRVKSRQPLPELLCGSQGVRSAGSCWSRPTP